MDIFRYLLKTDKQHKLKQKMIKTAKLHTTQKDPAISKEHRNSINKKTHNHMEIQIVQRKTESWKE